LGKFEAIQRLQGVRKQPTTNANQAKSTFFFRHITLLDLNQGSLVTE